MIPFTLNWFGMAVHDVPATTEFYSKKLGFSFWQDEEKLGMWRMFETRRMKFELFKAHSERLKVTGWGTGQAFRPAILVNNLASATARLQDQGVSLFHEASEFGPQVEIMGPEGIRWSLVENPGIEMDWSHPVIGGIELKAANLNAQKDFYTRVFGMKIENKTGSAIQLTQSSGEAWLRIQPGGTATSLTIGVGSPKPAFFFPIWISYETEDIKQTDAWLQQQKVTIIRPLTHHEDWNGTDVIITDVDGNAIQVVQYGKLNGE